MIRHERVPSDRDVPINYHQFAQGPGVRVARRVAAVFTWPLVLPLALLSRLSDFVFRTASEALSTVPYVFGVIVRQEFYRWTLTRCGGNVAVGFGTIFHYRDVSIGDNVAIGNYCLIHFCDLGSYVLVADGCQLLSGPHYHNFDRTDVPIALQGGRVRRIRVGDDCWVGAGAIVMNDLGEGSVVGAGSVVNEAVEPYSIVAGVPAKLLRKRK
jgi:acetyltransferase-like isoleucine patch superfamily enzyme